MAATSERHGDLTFAADLFKAADKMRGSVEPSEYKHIALGLIFLKYISDAFEAQRAKLAEDEYADPEDPDEYLAANVFWMPAEARWSNLQARAKSPEIGKLTDDAMDAIEKVPSNEKLKGALPKGYARPALNKVMLRELIDLFSGIGMHNEFNRARDLFGRVYEYCLSSFASTEGRRGGELLAAEGWRVNHKKVGRLWREEGLQLPARHRKRKRLYHHDASVIRLRPKNRTASGRLIFECRCFEHSHRVCTTS